MNGLLALSNSQPGDVRVILEPWCEERTLSSGSTLDVAFDGPSGGRIEIEMKPGEMIVYAWEGATMSFVGKPARDQTGRP